MARSAEHEGGRRRLKMYGCDNNLAIGEVESFLARSELLIVKVV